jgi:hypothetical protein
MYTELDHVGVRMGTRLLTPSTGRGYFSFAFAVSHAGDTEEIGYPIDQECAQNEIIRCQDIITGLYE